MSAKLNGGPRDFIDEEEYEHQLGPDYIIPTNEFRQWKIHSAVRIDETTSDYPMRPISIPTAFKRIAERYSERETLFVERNGRWISWTFKQYYEETRLIAKAFIRLGLKRHHSVAILGFNSPEWLMSEIAAILAGGIATGIYLTNTSEAAKFVLEDSLANICLVDGDFQLKKILQVRDGLPGLKAIVQWTGKPTAPGILSWEDLLKIGKSVPDAVLERRIKGISINEPCILLYTSGTTGNGKGVLICHDNFLYGATAAFIDWFDLKAEKDRIVSYLPLNHSGAQTVDIFANLTVGVPLYFARPDALKGTLIETFKVARPTLVLGVPRVWEKIYANLSEAESQMGYVKKAIFKWAKKCGIKRSIMRMNGGDSESMMFNLAEKLVLNVIKEKLGLSETKHLISAAAPIDKNVLHYLHSLDLPLIEFYGLTESSALISGSRYDKYRFGSSGRILCINKLKISEQEICVKGRNVFMGYLNEEEQTKQTIDDDGYLHTGDIGHLDEEGFLYITGRLKELLITAGGENVAPVPIETNVKKELQDIVSNAMVIADKRKFLTILLTLKTELDSDGNVTDNLTNSAKQWLRERQCDASTVKDVLNKEHKNVIKGFEDGITNANKKAISHACKVQKFRILPRDFSIAGGELGPTMKLKRQFTTKKYENIIDNLYV